MGFYDDDCASLMYILHGESKSCGCAFQPHDLMDALPNFGKILIIYLPRMIFFISLFPCKKKYQAIILFPPKTVMIFGHVVHPFLTNKDKVVPTLELLFSFDAVGSLLFLMIHPPMLGPKQASSLSKVK